MYRSTLALLLGALALGTSARAAPVEGVVMQVFESKELFVNVGTGQGLAPGTVLNVFRRVVLTHPITQKTIEDRFLIGKVKVAEAGALLSIVRDFTGLKRPPVAGDYVVVGRLPRSTPAVAVAADCPTPEVIVTGPFAPAELPEVADLNAALRDGLGESPEARIRLLTEYRAAYPRSRFRAPVIAAISMLEAQIDGAHAADNAAPGGLIARFDPVRKVEAQRTLVLATAIVDVAPLAEVRLLARRKGDPRWMTVKMAPVGVHHYSAPFPPRLLAEPGQLQYAIEAVRADGAVRAITGTLMQPRALTVEAIPAGEEPPGASHAEFMVRYVDFNASGEGEDRYVQSEARFRYGVRYKMLHSVEVGVGLINGDGGTVLDLAEGLPSDPTSMGYAYAAMEFEFVPLLGLGVRIIRGNRRSEEGNASSSKSGAQAHLRVGDDEATYLIAGLSVVESLGSRYFAEFHAHISDTVPFTAAIEATNLPVSADYGARGTGTVGWQATDWLTLRGELGLNARTIKHYGYTVGGGLAFDWE
ncbi:MAG: hypothetical protein ACI9U2_004611 [Bradymonadia bacterium]|jgi:hypothetical protein